MTKRLTSSESNLATPAIPINRIKKQELAWMASHTCQKHRHSYLSHYSCYLAEKHPNQRIGHFDLEASNLQSDFGITLCYAILDNDTGKIYSSVLKPADIHSAKAGDEDKKVMQDMIRDLGRFDRLVTWYGSGFDFPFARTRATVCGLEFPAHGALLHTDLYFAVRGGFNMSSKRLENVCRVLLGTTNKTRINNAYWRAAVRGEPKSLAYVLDHCEKDVQDLKRVYDKVQGHYVPTDRSA